MTEEVLNNYDIVSSRHDYITGKFCLYRNNKMVNELFMQSRDYKKEFSSPQHFCFDECNFLFKELQNGASVFDYPDNIQSMTWVVKDAERKSMLKAFFDFIIVEGVPGKIKWEKGCIIYKMNLKQCFITLLNLKQHVKEEQC